MCSFFFAAQRETSGFDGLRGIPSRGCALQLDIVEEMAQEARNRQVFMDRRDNRLGCVGEDDCKIGEAGEKELLLVVSVRCGKERDMTCG